MISAKSLATQFNAAVKDLTRRLERKARTDEEIANIDRLNKRISLTKTAMGPDSLVAMAAPVLTTYAERILDDDVERRDNFFLTIDARGEYAKSVGRVAPEDEFVFTLVNSIKQHYAESSRAEREIVCGQLREMLACCIEYNLI